MDGQALLCGVDGERILGLALLVRSAEHGDDVFAFLEQAFEDCLTEGFLAVDNDAHGLFLSA